MSITRISEEEAQQFIKVTEDYTNSEAAYFTLVPDPEYGEGWDKVTYYTNRRKEISIPKGATNCQWIYILSNSTLPGLVKIGFTKNLPTDRVKQINAGTGVAMDFDVEWSFPCFNAHDLEKEIHAYLEEGGFRVNKKKEFFNISVMEAKAVIERIGEPYKMEDNGSI